MQVQEIPIRFDRIPREGYLHAFEEAVETARAEVHAIASNPEAPTFENTVEALEYSGRELADLENLFFNLLEADSDDVMQETAEKVTTANMDAAAYQAHMALVAIKNGGILGVGLGKSMQKQYYLPECHTDFIFAVGAEELGLFFSIAVVVLFLVFFCISVYIARNASDRFGRFLVIGMAFIVFFQAVFNLGVVCEALPTKGMALPFFSYGGTNLLSAFFAVGTILSVGIHSYRDKKRILARSVLTRV